MSYTATAARLAEGTIVELGNNDADPLASPPTPETFTPVGEITALGKSGAKTDTPDATNMQSGRFREFISGLSEAGELGVTSNWSPGDDSHAFVEEPFNSGERRHVKVIVPPDPSAAEMPSPGDWGFLGMLIGCGD